MSSGESWGEGERGGSVEIDVRCMGTRDNIALKVEASEQEEDEDGSENLMRWGRQRRRRGWWRSERFVLDWVRGSIVGDWCTCCKKVGVCVDGCGGAARTGSCIGIAGIGEVVKVGWTA